jgi:hypothetical protein
MTSLHLTATGMGTRLRDREHRTLEDEFESDILTEYGVDPALPFYEVEGTPAL